MCKFREASFICQIGSKPLHIFAAGGGDNSGVGCYQASAEELLTLTSALGLHRTTPAEFVATVVSFAAPEFFRTEGGKGHSDFNDSTELATPLISAACKLFDVIAPPEPQLNNTFETPDPKPSAGSSLSANLATPFSCEEQTVTQQLLSRDDFSLSDHVSFTNKKGGETCGLISNLYPKTARVVLADGGESKVSYPLLKKLATPVPQALQDALASHASKAAALKQKKLSFMKDDYVRADDSEGIVLQLNPTTATIMAADGRQFKAKYAALQKMTIDAPPSLRDGVARATAASEHARNAFQVLDRAVDHPVRHQ